MKPTKPTNETDTKVITNFGGRLTRIENGDLNSGFTKFETSFGYDPFSSPGDLTWFEQPVDITGPMGSGVVMAGLPRYEGGQGVVYLMNQNSKLYKIAPESASTPNLDSVIGITSIRANSPDFDFGSSMEVYGTPRKLYISSDNQINAVPIPVVDGTADVVVGNSANYAANVARPLKQFAGNLIFGNRNTIGAIGPTATVISSIIGTGNGNLYSQISPPLPVDTYVQDIDLSPDGNQLYVTGSNLPNIEVSGFDDSLQASASQGSLFKWNGSDTGITASLSIPSYAITALQTYLSQNIFFSSDAFGAAVNDPNQKLLTLPGNQPALPNATLVNGNFVSWAVPEVVNGNQQGASLYYFGALDAENPKGLYRVMRQMPSIAGAFVNHVPMNIMTNNKYQTLDNSLSSIITTSYGKHYISQDIETPSTSYYRLYRFLVTSTGTGTPQTGVYETQTELYSQKRIIKQIRVYTSATIAGNGFQIDCIDPDGSIISNGTFTYTYAAGTDETLLQGALNRINFNPEATEIFGLALRITNTGTTNMTIKKIEIDTQPAGK